MPSVHSTMPLLLCIWFPSPPAAAKFSAGAGVDAHRGAHYIQAAHHKTGSHGAARTDRSLAGGAPPPGRGIHGDGAAGGLTHALAPTLHPGVASHGAERHGRPGGCRPALCAARLGGSAADPDGHADLRGRAARVGPPYRGRACQHRGEMPGGGPHGRGDADRDHRGALGPLGLRRAGARAQGRRALPPGRVREPQPAVARSRSW